MSAGSSRETAKETQAFVYENGERLDRELLDQIKAESDIQVNEADKDAFIAASGSIYEEFGQQVEGGKEMIDKAISLGQGS
jgi:TRAP-type C4-dicarboxylate transport system substrate-binding protein